VGLIVLAVMAAPRPASSAASEVFVDCAKGETMARALQSRLDPLVIELRGTCVESVSIERSRVTVRGADPALDGIQGSVSVAGAFDVRFENLFVTGSPSHGITTRLSEVNVANCRLTGNSQYGVQATGGGLGLSASTLTGNGRGGLLLEGHNTTSVSASVIKDNPVAGRGEAIRDDHSAVTVESSDLGGRSALTALSGQASILGSTLSGSLGAHEASLVLVYQGSLTGRVQATNHSLIKMLGVAHGSAAGLHVVDDASMLEVTDDFEDNPGTFTGPVILNGFSHFVLQGASTYTGTLSCRSGADAYCGPATGFVGTSDCALCIRP
jgi:hypothetical protein